MVQVPPKRNIVLFNFLLYQMPFFLYSHYQIVSSKNAKQDLRATTRGGLPPEKRLYISIPFGHSVTNETSPKHGSPRSNACFTPDRTDSAQMEQSSNFFRHVSSCSIKSPRRIVFGSANEIRPIMFLKDSFTRSRFHWLIRNKVCLIREILARNLEWLNSIKCLLAQAQFVMNIVL